MFKKKTKIPEKKYPDPIDIRSIDAVRLNDPHLSDEILEMHITKLNIMYPIDYPYAFVNIFFDQEEKSLLYRVLEPGLVIKEEMILREIVSVLEDTLAIDFSMYDESKLKTFVRNEIEKIIKKYKVKINPNSKERIIYYIIRDFVGYGKINPITKDPNIEDISCDGPGIPVYVYHRVYGSMRTNVIFKNHEELDSFIIKMAQRCGRHLSVAEPLLDGALPNGSRVQLTLGKEVTMRGSTFTIRKFREDPFTPVDLVKFGTFSIEMLAYIWYIMEHESSILIAGGTASGKTTTLNALSLFIKPELKIITIEDTPELNLPHENWIPSVTRTGFGPMMGEKKLGEIDMFELLKSALRQRPEYIIVGEVRGEEAYTLFQAIATGHAAMGTIHADSPQGVIHRLESEPINVPRILIKNIDCVLLEQRAKVKDKLVRRISQIVEIIDLDPTTNEVITNTLYEWNPFKDTFEFTGRSYLLEKMSEKIGVSLDDIKKEIENRERVLRWMIENNIRFYKDVADVIASYYKDPQSVLEKIGGS
ncbi:MAG TPA: secretion system protein E [Methanomicrobia archaeon]|nr:MAG: secretion system protein E [Thermococci archaeon]RLG01052.1 MAG: secretion system protein E [Thermococci archaeon]HDN81172.1 secretion system protein E [Methanomicrobia archaeon]HEC95421.1 secretion system protein E [Euryarchaeota archaeon]